METGRGKKGKKWHLTLGLKDAIFAGIGVVGLMMISFTLGTLSGRGDIYRVAYSWGLLAPEAKPAAQLTPQLAPALPVAEAPATAPAVTPTVAASSPAPTPAAPTATTAGPRSAQPAPVTGSIAPLPAPAAAASPKKKAKSAQAQEQKAREDHLRQTHQDVAKKLTFLNSFDSTQKTGLKKEKDKAKSPPAQVKVATYRDSKTAKAKLAELQKKGVKASLKQGKDDQGVTYTLYRQAPAAKPKEGENLAQGKEKTAPAASSHKPQAQ